MFDSVNPANRKRERADFTCREAKPSYPKGQLAGTFEWQTIAGTDSSLGKKMWRAKRTLLLHMVKMIRHRETGAFFCKGEWTDDCKRADRFTDIMEVLRVQREHRLTSVELVVLAGSEPGPLDTVAPLLDSCET